MQLKQQKLNISTKAYLIKKDPCVNSNKYEYYDLVQNTLTAYKSVRISSYSNRMRENTDQSNSEYGHFSRGDLKHQ